MSKKPNHKPNEAVDISPYLDRPTVSDSYRWAPALRPSSSQPDRARAARSNRHLGRNLLMGGTAVALAGGLIGAVVTGGSEGAKPKPAPEQAFTKVLSDAQQGAQVAYFKGSMSFKTTGHDQEADFVAKNPIIFSDSEGTYWVSVNDTGTKVNYHEPVSTILDETTIHKFASYQAPTDEQQGYAYLSGDGGFITSASSTHPMNLGESQITSSSRDY